MPQLSRAGPVELRLRSFQFKSQSLHSETTLNEPFLVSQKHTHTQLNTGRHFYHISKRDLSLIEQMWSDTQQM